MKNHVKLTVKDVSIFISIMIEDISSNQVVRRRFLSFDILIFSML